MLNNMSINFRFIVLSLLSAVIFITIGLFAYKSFEKNHTALKESDLKLKTINLGIDLNNDITQNYTKVLNNLDKGYISWDEGINQATSGLETIKGSISTFNNSINKANHNTESLNKLYDDQILLIEDYNLLIDFLNVTQVNPDNVKKLSKYVMALSIYPERSNATAADILRTSINSVTDNEFSDLTSKNHEMVAVAEDSNKSIFLVGALGTLFIVIVGYLIGRSINKPTKELTEVVSRLSNGEFDARANITGKDEIAKLSTAFNSLLDDRAVTLTKIDEEHQELNQSVFSLLQAVADLSERDLTIRAKVTEDATGPVADALNLLAEETADTMKEVKNVANNVNKASNKVNTHLLSINKLAMKEQSRAIDTADQMNAMIQRLDSISNTAASTNTMAGKTTTSTKQAQKSVTDTLTGMSDIRTTVQETGKRIKQLGERSQEISHVIEIIETIAERTTLLALNASMQAAAAGDEGKGFSIIAEEIQRLAESSRESTGQISTLVSNIQQETNTTIETMDKTIEQVIDGSVKAAEAADQMNNVLETTTELVEAVDQIATASKDQVTISKNLKHKAESILKSTQVTGKELLSLTGLSRNMSEYAQQLVTSVEVFKLDNEDEKELDTYSNEA